MDKPNETRPVYVYTQHVPSIRVVKEACGEVIVLTQDRTKDPVDDVLSQINDGVLYAVLPVDKAIELRQRAPYLTVRLLQLDGAVIEKSTGRPYDPKAEYSVEILKAALTVIEVKGGSIRYMTFKEMIDEITRKGYRTIAIFNDVMREGIRLALQRIGVADVELVKTCGGSCVEVNPLGFKSGYRVSFPGTAGRLTPEQIAEALLSGTARIYHVDIDAEVVPLCERPESQGGT
jgi:hypothetical protein